MNYDSFLELVKKRRSIRRFKADPIPRETVEKILEAARHAPSAANSQPWEFVIVEDTPTKKSIVKALSYGKVRKLDPTFYFEVSVQAYLVTAPVLVLVCGDKRVKPAYPSFMEDDILLRQSLAVCIYTMQLAAASCGLATAWATIGKGEIAIKKLLGIPDIYTVDHIVPLAYLDEKREVESQTLRPVRERAPLRRELKEIVHYGRYDMGKFRSDEEVRDFIWDKTVTRIPQ
ncbi:nitroreductase family protein [Chloroflexota bacterium]